LTTNIIKRRFFDVTEICEITGVSRPTVFRAIKRGEIKAKKLGRKLLIPASFIEELEGGNGDGNSC